MMKFIELSENPFIPLIPIYSWTEIKGKFPGKTMRCLIGNGAASAFYPDFDYKVKTEFGKIQTANVQKTITDSVNITFPEGEKCLSEINKCHNKYQKQLELFYAIPTFDFAHKIYECLGIPTSAGKNSGIILDNIMLFLAVHRNTSSLQINEEGAKKLIPFLDSFEGDIFSTNFFNDFKHESINKKIKPLHGDIYHWFSPQKNVIHEIPYTEREIWDSIYKKAGAIHDSRLGNCPYPALVIGTTETKPPLIMSYDYTKNAWEEFKKILSDPGNILVVFGQALSGLFDGHILRAITNGNLSKLIIFIHGDTHCACKDKYIPEERIPVDKERLFDPYFELSKQFNPKKCKQNFEINKKEYLTCAACHNRQLAARVSVSWRQAGRDMSDLIFVATDSIQQDSNKAGFFIRHTAPDPHYSL